MEPRIEFLTKDQSKRGKHRHWPTDLKARLSLRWTDGFQNRIGALKWNLKARRLLRIT